jgi:tricarballylate dehydrogenase
VSDQSHVVVVGAGLAGLSAAISAREAGAEVTLIEKGGPDDVGGNAAFSGGLLLLRYHDAADLLGVTESKAPSLSAERVQAPGYSAASYVDDLMEMSGGRTDRALAEVLAAESLEVTRWMARCGVRFEFGDFGAYVRDGTLHVPPSGQALHSCGGRTPGLSMILPLVAHAERLGVCVEYSCALKDLVAPNQRVTGIVARGADGDSRPLPADAVVIASGGFQGSASLRRERLGAQWEAVRLRGTRHSTGDGIQAALRVGAGSAGDWSSCHSAAVDPAVPEPQRNDDPSGAQLHSFWLGIMVNRLGHRFVDEGPGAWIRHYSKMGKAILSQPDREAWQIFDQRTAERVLASHPTVMPIIAGSMRELAGELGLPATALEHTVDEFNRAADDATMPFEPDIEDGRRTVGLTPDKSNWAVPIDHPPFVALAATTGLTFTLAGLRIDSGARVLDESGSPIAGLYAAGECTGGLFFADYPGGSGLMRAAVLGRVAGQSAAIQALAA